MTTQDALDERYGRRRSPRARWIRGGFIGLAVVVVGAFAWMTVANAFDDIAAERITASKSPTSPDGR